MKRTVKILFWVAVMCFITACSNESSPYNPAQCDRLKTMIDSGEKLSDADYSEMVDQILGGIQVINNKNKEIGDNNKKKQKEFLLKDKNHKMMENIIEFTFYLEEHRNDLSPAIEQRRLEAQRELMKLRD